jgi:hypothetical protein
MADKHDAPTGLQTLRADGATNMADKHDAPTGLQTLRAMAPGLNNGQANNNLGIRI